MDEYLYESDVVVIGAGNAGMCAALSARENGSNVIVLEKAPKKERGGNSTFSSGAFRFAYNGTDDLLKVIPNLPNEDIENSDFGVYTKKDFFEDMRLLSENRSDSTLQNILVNESLPTLIWMQSKRIRFTPIFGRQAFKINGKFKFWGGLVLEAADGGNGLIKNLHEQAEKDGIKVLYKAEATKLIQNDDDISGVEVKLNRKTVRIKGKSIVLASGGFQSNTEMRTRYLGPGWELAKVRGTRYNTGDGIRMALELGARTYGHWSGCHAVGWDYNAPEYGSLDVGEGFQKHSYPFGIMVNATGQRFIDEGADFRNYTHAKYGRVILEQPRQFAWQVFDQQVIHLLRDEYRIKGVTKVQAKTLEELAEKLEGVNPKGFLDYISKYNEAVQVDVPFNPNIKDGRGTVGLEIPKTNWANTIEEGPFVAYRVTCGITFTFGGLKINSNGEVLNSYEKPIPGLYAAGELVGGLFYFNYPGGTSLMAGAVFGRLVGKNASDYANKRAVLI